MRLDGYRTQIAKASAAELLAAIRVDAMRPSLEAAGRFDPIRARERFLKSFNPDETEIIYLGAEIVGFFVVRRHVDHFYLDHLYITPKSQGRGIGRLVIEALKKEASVDGVPIRLMALNGSPSNTFYKQNEFRFVSSDDLDTVYEVSEYPRVS